MKIVQFNDNYKEGGGASVVFSSTIALLKKNGNDVHTFAFGKESIRSNNIFVYKESRNKFIRYLNNYFNLKIYLAFKKFLDETEPDIIHLHNNFKNTVAILLAVKRSKIPVVQTLHDFRILCPSLYATIPKQECKSIFKLACIKKRCIPLSWYIYFFITEKIKSLLRKKSITIFIAPSRILKREIEKELKLKNVGHIPNFAHIKNFKKKAQENSILYVGELSEHKGLAYLIYAFSKVLLRFPSSRLYLVGKGDYEQKLKILIKGLGVEKSITFVGELSKEEVINYYKEANMLILPSTCRENCPLVILEAMSFGLPVIASNMGGIPELVKNGKTGFLFEPHNSTDLAEKIIKVLKNPRLGRELGDYARKICNKNFNPNKYYENLIKVYNEAIIENEQ